MKSGELFVERVWVENSVRVMLNASPDGRLVLREIHPYEPQNDRRILLDTAAKVRRPLDRLLEFCKTHRGRSFSAGPGLDGVIYEIRYESKMWSLFCPEESEDKDVATLGKLVDELLRSF